METKLIVWGEKLDGWIELDKLDKLDILNRLDTGF